MILALLIHIFTSHDGPDRWHRFCEQHIVADDPYDDGGTDCCEAALRGHS